MTIKIDNINTQFDLRLEKVFGENSKTSERLGSEAAGAIKGEISDLINEVKSELLKELNSEIDGLISQVTKELLGNNAFSNGISNALDTAVGQVISGNGIDARSISNSAARAFTPIVNDFIFKSSSQAADEFSSLLGLAQRNS